MHEFQVASQGTCELAWFRSFWGVLYQAPDAGLDLAGSSRLQYHGELPGRREPGHAPKKNGPKGAVMVNQITEYQLAFFLATPTNPSRPEPNSQTAAGTGTTVACRIRPLSSPEG